jgi:hypothetical protein
MTTTVEAQIPDVADQAVTSHKKSPEESFGELRKAKEDAERQAWQAKKELELMQRQLDSQRNVTPMQTQEEDFDFNQLENEDFPDGKKLGKAFGSLNKKFTSYEQKLHEKEAKILALEFAVDHPDFKNVVTPENIEKYIKSDEDHCESVEKASNPLRKCYNLIKKDMRYQADQAIKNKPISQEQKKVEEKEIRPKTSSVGVRSEAISTAAIVSNSKMTKEQKAELWRQTEESKKRFR